MSKTLYKVLRSDGSACHGGSGEWKLPRGKRPGKWMPSIAGIQPCERGYHLCREGDLVSWLGPTIWIAEARGERIDADDKIVVSQARLLSRCTAWDARTMRLFSSDCAERVLPIYEHECPGDMRPRQAIEAARAYARGEIDAAAWSAARGAARAAAWSAAWPAAGPAARSAAWPAADAAASAAAWPAADDAADDAAGTAARAAAWSAERAWQTERLMWYLRGGEEIDAKKS